MQKYIIINVVCIQNTWRYGEELTSRGKLQSMWKHTIIDIVFASEAPGGILSSEICRGG